jgi:hypothetical protein
MANHAPDPDRCKKAIKILEQFDRLAQKLGIRIPPRRLQRLIALRDSGTIKSTDLPAGLLREFPGEFAGLTLAEIRRRCGKR